MRFTSYSFFTLKTHGHGLSAVCWRFVSKLALRCVGMLQGPVRESLARGGMVRGLDLCVLGRDVVLLVGGGSVWLTLSYSVLILLPQTASPVRPRVAAVVHPLLS